MSPMWMLHRWLCVSVLVGVACWASALFTTSHAKDRDMVVISQASAGPLRCEIHRSDDGNAVLLAGSVSSTQPLDGNFRFAVMKSGPSGSSNINQSNKFHADAKQQVYVGKMTVGLEPGAHAAIELSVSSNGITCETKASVVR